MLKQNAKLKLPSQMESSLQALVSELVKETPNQEVIKRLTEHLKIPYSRVHLEQIDLVMDSLNKACHENCL